MSLALSQSPPPPVPACLPAGMACLVTLSWTPGANNPAGTCTVIFSSCDLVNWQLFAATDGSRLTFPQSDGAIYWKAVSVFGNATSAPSAIAISASVCP